MDDDELRRRLVEAGHPAVTGPGRLRVVPGAGRDGGRMSEHSIESAASEWPHAASDRARESENWRPLADDYPAAEGGAGAWADPDSPGLAPRPMVGTDVARRPGWLLAGRQGDDGPDGAA